MLWDEYQEQEAARQKDQEQERQRRQAQRARAEALAARLKKLNINAIFDWPFVRLPIEDLERLTEAAEAEKASKA